MKGGPGWKSEDFRGQCAASPPFLKLKRVETLQNNLSKGKDAKAAG